MIGRPKCERRVQYTEAIEFAERLHFDYVETSAKTGMGLMALFQAIAYRVGEANLAIMHEYLVEPRLNLGDSQSPSCC